MADELKKWEIERLGALTLQELKMIFSIDESLLVPFSGRPLARVFSPPNEIEAAYLVSVLRQEGIPALFQSFKDTAFDGIFVPARGVGTILTLVDDAEAARQIIEELESQERTIADEDADAERTDVLASDPDPTEDNSE